MLPVLFVLLPPLVCTAQSPASPAKGAAPKPTETPSLQGPATDQSPTPATPAKPKHVITNEDIEHRPNVGSAEELTLPGASPLLACDPSCEQEARASLNYDDDNEGEWRVQVAQARRELATDANWRGMLSQGIQQARYYCNFLYQQQQQNAPSGNSWNARQQRARNAKYFEDMDRALRQGMQNTLSRMQDRIGEVEVLSPVRAAMMSVQAQRIFERDCDPPGTR
jgi:hypothetical protein